ncbi:prepilin-type N-terminal cleavage/methylation domain-containing protein [Acinetobacter defluvii]|uniref:Type II secretion system protein H n=1 Tax=Acinetobacter defluvii TaxID=1871111 RepID=A0A2S2FHV4_9GAMM|nr:GspH/FimT family pseudopilin [Acinetobacter defluvii]AWL30547.1 prepilin-type N-terminal cleavage/methylation domain-containing protein [Acinetobacter defluvii]
MYLYCKQYGLTLVELVICVCVIGILASISTPYYLHILQERERKNIFPLLDQHIKFAKNSAILHHSTIIICSTSDLQSCQDDQWNRSILIFIDKNNNKQRDSNEPILQETKTQFKYGSLKWAGSITHQKLLAFRADTGLPRGSSGSFYYCSLDDSSLHLRFKMGQMAHLRQESTATC